MIPHNQSHSSMYTYNFLLTAIAKLHVKIAGEVFNRVYLFIWRSQQRGKLRHTAVFSCAKFCWFADILLRAWQRVPEFTRLNMINIWIHNWVWQLQYVKNTSIMNFDFVPWSRRKLTYLKLSIHRSMNVLLCQLFMGLR